MNEFNLQVSCDGGQCVAYGFCGNNPLTNKPAYCPYNGPAKPLNDSMAVSSLTESCPELMADLSK